MCEICVEHYLLLEMLIMVKYMNILYYEVNWDIACPRTNSCTNVYSCDICKIVHAVVVEKWHKIDETSEIERDRMQLVPSGGGGGV